VPTYHGDDGDPPPTPALWRRIRHRLWPRQPKRQEWLSQSFIDDLGLVGDTAHEAGVIDPALRSRSIASAPESAPRSADDKGSCMAPPEGTRGVSCPSPFVRTDAAPERPPGLWRTVSRVVGLGRPTGFGGRRRG
jgi:hypothetical protein